MNNLTMRLDLADGDYCETTGMSSSDVQRFVGTWLSGSTETFEILTRRGVTGLTYPEVDAVTITR